MSWGVGVVSHVKTFRYPDISLLKNAKLANKKTLWL